MEPEEFLTTCVMAGCEYIQNIDRVGLKRVLNDYKKAGGSCHEVIKALQDNKAFKDKVPPNYWEDVQKVKTIFKFQTVYDPRSKQFVPIHQPKEGETFDQKYVGSLIDPDDQENYALGKIHKKTLQPIDKYIDMFDIDLCRRDYKDNCISERSFRCTDLSFFDDNRLFWEAKNKEGNIGDQNVQGTSMRHGIYAYSSKDWAEVKQKIIEETNKAKEDFIQKKKEEEKDKTEEEKLQEQKEQEAEEIK